MNSIILLSKINDLAKKVQNTEECQNGASAYEIAVNAGFQGTKEEWLRSLKGERGEKGNSLKFKSFKQPQSFSSFEKWGNGTEVAFNTQFFDHDELTKGDNLAITGVASDKDNLKVLLIGVVREVSDGSVKFIGKSLTSLSDGVSSNVYTKSAADKNFISKRAYASLSDLDNQEDTGFAKIASLSAAHLPPGVKWGVSQFVHENPGVIDSHGRKTGVQIYYPIDGENKDYLFYRSVLGTWSDWKQIATTKYVDQKIGGSLEIEERDGWVIERSGSYVTMSGTVQLLALETSVRLPVVLDSEDYVVSVTANFPNDNYSAPAVTRKSREQIYIRYQGQSGIVSVIIKGKTPKRV